MSATKPRFWPDPGFPGRCSPSPGPHCRVWAPSPATLDTEGGGSPGAAQVGCSDQQGRSLGQRSELGNQVRPGATGGGWAKPGTGEVISFPWPGVLPAARSLQPCGRWGSRAALATPFLPRFPGPPVFGVC